MSDTGSTDKEPNDLVDSSDADISPKEVDVDSDGTPRHDDGNTDACSNSDTASGGAPE